MSTPAQATASRANGALSHGPITEEGKAKSSQNALSHGMRSTAVVLPGEDPEKFVRHQADYIECFRPANQPERDLVLAMSAARWRLNRLMALESQLLQESEDLGRALNTVSRYEGQLNRTYNTAFKQLEVLRANRPPSTPANPKPPSVATGESVQPNEPGDSAMFALLDALTAPPAANTGRK
ncbi:MAG TPA: hypothetical protein VN841_06150 [Bryobacteraceae bacterium]|nr:hypothetical protein [Bryobacteraceae bacterium]